jgi:hypothetical protein
MKIQFGDFNAKVGRENIFKPKIGNRSLHHNSNDNSVKKSKLCHIKYVVVKSMKFLHQNIHKDTWTYPDGKACNKIDHSLIGGIRVYSKYNLSGELTVILYGGCRS